jgi:suppressor for copper-sensitivity B
MIPPLEWTARKVWTGRRQARLSGACAVMGGWTALLLLLVLAIVGQSAQAATSDWVNEQHGAARLISAVEATGSSTQLDIGLQLRLTPGWHTYWRSPGDAGISPVIDWKGSENLAGAEIAWPAPVRLPSLGDLETIGYEGGVVLPIAVRLVHPGAPLHLHADVDYASCRDICIPYHASLDLVLPSGLAQPGTEAALIAAAQRRVPVDISAAQWKLLGAAVGTERGSAVLSVRLASLAEPFASPDLFIEGLAKGSAGRPAVSLADSGRTATLHLPINNEVADAIAGTKLRITVVDGAHAGEADITPVFGILAPIRPDATLGAILGIALLGGLILNLMPCVLPVLSLKLLALTGYAGAERRAARLGLLATAAGVILSFGVLAATLIALKAAGSAIGWGIQFQQPWFLAGMALITTLFAASLWGWMPIGLPAGIAGAVGSMRGHGRASNAFLMGAFATLLAASCSAPFVGTAIGFALARAPLDIALVFGALGLGMAAPFLTVAALPQLVAYLPRPGRWMVALERVLALALLGTAAWLLSILALEAGPKIAVAAGVMLALLLAAIAWSHRLPIDRSARGVVGTAALMLAALVVLLPSWRGQAVSMGPTNSPSDTQQWQVFDEATLRRMVSDGKLVFVDVTAAWCLTCKANELAVLDRPPVVARLHDPDVIAMRADWTRPNPAITTYLQSFGRYGVPLDVVYGPGAPQGIALPELLSAEAVMDAFRRAATAGVRKQEAIE